ncbi:Ig-like domain-containing protein [Aliikangiella coralliicola]|uniref:Tandem-95 repeat protein n=1 Tax=Aliikangiella coralliicola TaxID=2592383 RepID=A0A545UC97_9GAMM|nr:Ig-like domain-containing protein [Aliikangiella coralliicola]TQV87089.1 tandem-95 repeat protein [Aliikangiella coralliicola]
MKNWLVFILLSVSLSGQNVWGDSGATAVPTISYVSGSGPYPDGTRQVEISFTTDIPSVCKVKTSDKSIFEYWPDNVVSSNNLLHRNQQKLYGDHDTQVFIRCQSLESGQVTPNSFIFPIRFTKEDSFPQPQNLIADSPLSQNGDFTLSWETVTGATSYYLVEQKDDGLWNAVDLPSDELSVTLSRPEIGRYLYRVSACSDGDLTSCGEFSEEAIVSVGAFASHFPPIMQPLSGSGPYPAGTREVEFSITTNLESECRYSGFNEGIFEYWSHDFSSTDGLTHTNQVSLYGDYDKEVYVRCKATATGYTNKTSLVFPIRFTNGQVLSKPEQLSATPEMNLDGVFELTWNPVSGANVYHLMEKKDNELWKVVNLVEGVTAISLVRTELGRYEYQVAACSDMQKTQCSHFSDNAIVSVGADPLHFPPIINYVSGSGPHDETVSQLELAVSTNLMAECRLNKKTDGFEYWSRVFTSEDGTAHQFSLTPDSRVDQTWYVKCQSTENQYISDAFEFPIDFTEDTTLPKPLNFSVDKPINTGSYLLSWTPVEGAASYLFKERFDGGDWSYTTLSNDILQQSMNKTQTGEYQYLVVACNDQQGTDCGHYSKLLTVTVIPSGSENLAPVAQNLQVETDENTAASITLIASDPNDDTIVYTLVTQPQSGVLSGSGKDWTYTPQTDFSGTDSFTFKANDSALDSNIATVSILVNAINQPPIANPQSLATDEDNAIAVTLSGSDPNGDSLSFVVETQPANGVLTGTAPNLIYTPNGNFNGSDSFTFKTNDGVVDSVTVTVQLQVNAVNDLPIAVAQSLTVEEDGTLAITLTGSDVDGDALSYSIVTLPTQGVLSGDAPNLVYSPLANFNGSDTFTFIVNDGAADSNIVTVNLLVGAVNDAPKITSFPITVATQDFQYNYSIVAYDTDGDPLTYQLIDGPSGMTISVVGGGVSWSPTADDIGVHFVKLQVEDSLGASDIQEYVLTVGQQPNRAPVITSSPILTGVVNEAYTYTITANDLDNDSLIYRLIDGPAGMSVSAVSGLVYWVPSYTQTGSASVAVSVEDVRGAITQQSFSINVELGENQSPQITSAPVELANVDKLYSYQVTATDDEAESLEYVLTSLPDGMLINSETGLISWVADNSLVGSHSVTVKVIDVKGAFDEQPFVINVTAAEENLSPEIQSTSVNNALQNGVYHYDVEATDPNQDLLNYELDFSPENMTINPESGDITWLSEDKYLQPLTVENNSCYAEPKAFDKIEVQQAWRRVFTTLTPPIAVPLIDTNNDNLIDTKDIPVTLVANNVSLIAMRTDNGDLVWPEIKPGDLGMDNFSLRASVAAADIDNDGLLEIITVAKEGIYFKLIALENDGTLKWINHDVAVHDATDIVFGDLDKNGVIEILVGDKVFNSQGNLILEAEPDINVDTQGILGQQGLIIDLDLDGSNEILTGFHAYNQQGDELWNNRHLSLLKSGAAFGVGNFDIDDYPEIIVVSGHHASLIEHDGTVVWGPVALDIFDVTNVGGGGTPVIVDFDNDGFDEAFVVARSKATLLDSNGQILWQVDMDDSSSSSVGATAFDLNHDGVLEIIFTDEIAFYIIDSLTGTILYQDNSHNSGTIMEHPIVADLDGDDSVEILVTGYSGVAMYDSGSESWGSVISTWNQSRFYPSATDNQGQIVNEVNFWLTEGFNVNAKSSELLPDITAHGVVYDEDNQTLAVTILNRGQLSVLTDFSVKFYQGNPSNGGILLGESIINGLAKSASINVSVENIVLESAELLFVVIDESVTLLECDVTNNQIVALPVSVKVSDVYGLSDVQTYALNVKRINHPPQIISLAPQTVVAGNLYHYELGIKDDFGDVHQISLENSPSHMLVQQANQAVVWRTTDDDIGQHNITLTVTDAGGLTQVQNIVITVVANTGLVPEIQSLNLATAIESELYNFTIVANDPDGDNNLIVYELRDEPAGMTVNASSGEVSWTPMTSQVGEHYFSVVARDNEGLSNELGVTVTVVSNNTDNDRPVITSVPDFNAPINGTYQYQVVATDINGDPLTYQLRAAPEGMLINTAGLITWTLIGEPVGVHLVDILVFDDKGGAATQTYQLNVGDSQLPVVLSTPPLSAWVDQLYQYEVKAYDPEGSGLTYTLLNSPESMQIESNSGVITWTPSEAESGIQAVSIKVADSKNGSAFQNYSIFVNQHEQNHAPVITSEPSFVGVVDQVYTYQINAPDEDGDLLSYHVVSGPDNLSVDVNGLVTWTPGLLQVGEHSVTLQVDDSTYQVAQSYNITVYDEPLPLNIDVSVTPKVALIDQPVSIHVTASGGSGDKQIEVTVDGVSQSIIDDVAIFTPTAKGRYDVVVSANDGNQTVEENYFFTVGDADDTTPPIVTIHSPGSHAEITSLTEIVASIQDDNLANYFVALFEAGESLNFENATILASGSNNITEAPVAEFDPSVLLNGLYHILIQAEDLNGQWTTNSVTLRVTGDLKVGNFSITFEDKSIPLAGIPIRVTRTYDSRQKSKALDFGYGWSVGYQDVKIQESSQPTRGWRQYASNSLFNIDGQSVSLPSSCTSSFSEKLVTVTLPDGDVETFVAKGRPVSGGLVSLSHPDCTLLGGRYINLEFEAKDGTDSELVSLDGQSLYLTNVDGGNLALDIIETAAVDAKSYQLTTRTGFVYKLDQYFGIETVTDPNGNTLTYSDSGIVHSSGKSVTFNRDANGRIKSITDPNGHVIQYDYSATGNLKSVTDELGSTTNFTYNNSHGLLDITDLLGRKVVKNIYNDDGRLIAQEDSDGNRTSFDHDLAGRQSVVTDRLGRTTVLYYDDEGNVTSQVDALSGVTTFTFDTNGNQLSQTDPLGRKSTATYNDNDDQLTQTNALDETVSFTYNSRGQELTVSDESGHVFTNTYDAVGNLLSIKDPQDNVTGSDINAQGLPAKVTDALGNETTYTYDDEGNKLTETNPLGEVTTFTYDDNNNVLTETRSRTLADESVVNETTTYEYDKRNRVIKTTDALGNISTVEYDLVGNQKATVDSLNRRTEYDYDAFGRLTETRFADGSKTTKTYDKEGNLLTETDRLGRVTSFEYDGLNRLFKTTYADGSITQTEYDAVGQVTAEIDAKGNRTEHDYDLAGRRIKTTNALNNIHQFAYDANGNLTSETDALNRITSYTYDSLDRKTQTTFANTSTMSDGFDALARKTSMTDQAGVVTNYAYDALGRLLSVTDVEGNVTSFTYDEAGNKLTQTDAEGRTTSWSYDALGRVLTRTLPLGQVESFTYDSVGNMLTHTDFNGELSTYVYDTNNRVTSITYAKDDSVESFTYDLSGNRLTATSSLGTWTYTYDVMNRLSSETKPNGDKLEYGYDLNGNKTQLKVTYANGDIETETLSYDELNRLASLTDSEGNITTYGYDSVGNRTSVSYQNGSSQTYAYDNLNRLTRVQHYDGTGALIKQFDYTLHATGRRTKIDESNGRSMAYTFDSLYRLTGETITDSVNGNRVATFEYDKVGNRLAETIDGTRKTFTFDNNDRVLTNGSVTYSYDENGNTLTEGNGTTTKTFTYNAQNKLTSFSDGSATASYQYNVDGIRMSQTVNFETTQYLVDNNQQYAQVIAEIDSSDSVTKRYVYGDDLISQTLAGETYFYLYDGLGSTRNLTDSQGVVTDSYDYEAFGELLNQTGNTENAYRYTGEQFDETLNQYYLRARYYSQGVGRFTQQDTWMGRNFDPITLHKYLYANVDPVNNIDPTGNFSLGQALSAINTAATIYSVATSTYNVLESAAAGEGEVTAKDVGLAFLSAVAGATAGKLLKLLSKACKKKRQCNYLKARAEAEAKIRLKVLTIPNSRLQRRAKPWRIVVITGAYDIKRGRGTAATNGPAKPNARLQAHGRKFGLSIGQRNACGTRNTVGRCAEWRAAGNLTRSGSRVKHIRWTAAYLVRKGENGFARLGDAIPPCGICATAGFHP